ncbi:MAG: hypothetical protein RL204_1655 [Bacteroidota bacterium]
MIPIRVCLKMIKKLCLKIHLSLVLVIASFFTNCTSNEKPSITEKKVGTKSFSINKMDGEVSLSSNRHRWILQDKNQNYWFATDGDGAYKFDGKNFAHYEEKNGLCNNHVRSIQEDKNGNIWFATGDGICYFDGKNFVDQTIFTKKINNGSALGFSSIKDKNGNLWFVTAGGVYKYDYLKLEYLAIPLDKEDEELKNKSKDFNPFPYEVYAITQDKEGGIWLGTAAKGAYRYDGKEFKNYRGNGLECCAIRAIYQDKKGKMWFGNNGSGLFRLDGDKIKNITAEKGLENKDFIRTGMVTDMIGTLARVWTIAEDNTGNLWIGTIDSGVWRFDGTNLTNFTTENGLSTNSVPFILLDNFGNLIAACENGGIHKFEGNRFHNFIANY